MNADKMTYENWRQWKDWQRVLTYWKLVKNRHGLTLPALAHITQRPVDELWGEIKRRQSGAGGTFCGDIKGPVICMRWRRDWEVEGHPLRPPINVSYDTDNFLLEDKASFAEFQERQQEVLDKYPNCKGIRNWRGLVRFSPILMLPSLRAAARGDFSPFTGKKEAA